MSNQKFRLPASGPEHLSSEPQKAQAPEKVIEPGLDHRPFSENEIKQAFDTFDLDNNRFVGAMEIRHILEVIGEEATDEEIDEMIRMCDNDGDGQVTFDEFQKMMMQPPAPLPPALPPNRRPRGARRGYGKSGPQDMATAQQKGKKAMAEAAGALQKVRAESIEALVKRLAGGTARIKPSQIKRIYKRFQDIDVDHSGAVDYEEFCMALEMEDNHISRQMFKVFDMDDSGSIELKEFIVVLSRYTEASKAEKLKFAFMMFDEDGSGAIDRDELIEMMAASFVVEGYTREELEEKADQVFDTLGISQERGIEYHDFLKLANDKRALIYPIEEKRLITQGVSMTDG
eukprot:TRINITY_DN37176_c0_g1_i1.p1 TRINITY_DN37176_c0_g1~~TRINITY_DN37176_c0_g1_i1.p1  ORF type:complete len:344 (-),score=103.87 TRINITY_DN37176_c0_g1_i1:241-1272(-)